MNCKIVDVATTSELNPANITFPDNVQFTYTDVIDLVIDGITVNINDLVLVKNQSDETLNGVYEIISKQTIGSNIIYVFKRPNNCLYMQIGDYVFITSGTTNENSTFILSISDEILTIGESNLSFLPITPVGGGGGGGNFSCVVIPVLGIVSTGSLRYFTFGTPVDLVGSKASTITINPAAFGQTIESTDDIFRVDVQLCLQYSSQPGGNPRRTFLNITVNGVTVNACAQGVPSSTNNWRSTRLLSWFGINSGQTIAPVLNTNAVGPTTLNSGNIFLIFQS